MRSALLLLVLLLVGCGGQPQAPAILTVAPTADVVALDAPSETTTAITAEDDTLIQALQSVMNVWSQAHRDRSAVMLRTIIDPRDRKLRSDVSQALQALTNPNTAGANIERDWTATVQRVRERAHLMAIGPKTSA